MGYKGEGEVGEKARFSGWGDWQDSEELWGGTWFNAEWTKLEMFVGHLEVLLGGWSLRSCLGLSRLESEFQKGTTYHAAEAMGLCEAMGHRKGMILTHPDPTHSETSHGLLFIEAAA